jgi:hypothetical protein
MRLTSVRCVATLLVVGFSALCAQDKAVVLMGTKKKGTVPTGYKAYSLFLIPSSDWQTKTQELRDLRSAFSDFGDAIGDQKLAVWFSNEDDTKVDVNRSKTYCDKLGLSYNDGPFVVTTKSHPDALRTGEQAVVIKLSGIAIPRAISILNILEQDLRTEREIRSRSLLFEEVKQRLMTVKDRHGSELKDLATVLLKLK